VIPECASVDWLNGYLAALDQVRRAIAEADDIEQLAVAVGVLMPDAVDGGPAVHRVRGRRLRVVR
jgi:hypothetical protein